MKCSWKTVGFRDDTTRALARNHLKKFCSLCPNGMIVFPMFGTLLGIIRENDIIKHDGDIDVGFIGNEHMLDRYFLGILSNGWTLIRNQQNYLYTFIKNEIQIDMYKFVDNGERINNIVNGKYFIEYDAFKPLKKITFDNYEYNCIANPVKFFERFYGKDWQTPK